MGLFGKKKESVPIIEYDPETQSPVLKCSTVMENKLLVLRINRQGILQK